MHLWLLLIKQIQKTQKQPPEVFLEILQTLQEIFKQKSSIYLKLITIMFERLSKLELLKGIQILFLCLVKPVEIWRTSILLNFYLYHHKTSLSPWSSNLTNLYLLFDLLIFQHMNSLKVYLDKIVSFNILAKFKSRDNNSSVDIQNISYPWGFPFQLSMEIW